MSFEEEFDKIIRQKAEEAKYSFDEANWHKVSNMLEADRKVTGAARFTRVLLPIGALFLVGIAGYLSYTSFGTDNRTATLQKSLSKQAEIAAPPVTEKLVPVDRVTAQNTVQKTEAPAKSARSSELIPERSFANNHPEISQAPVKSQQTKSDLPKQTQQQGNSVQPSNFLNHPEETIKSQVAQRKSGNVSQQDKNDKDDVAATTNGQNLSEASADYTDVIEEEPTVNVVAKGPAPEDIAETQLSSEFLNPIWLLVPEENSNYELKEPFQYPVIKDEDYYNKGKLAKTQFLNIDLGGAYLFGWDKEKTKDGKGLDYYAGINYGRYISRKLSISAGIQVYNVSNINQPYYSVSHKEYGFGSTTIYTVVTASDLLFASVPVKINYAMGHNNAFGLGVNIGYLMAANSHVQQYYLRDNEKIMLAPASNSKQIYEGTQSLNVMLSASYSLKLSNRLALKAEYVFGLTDLFKNSGQIYGNEKVSGLRFGLQYTLFDK